MSDRRFRHLPPLFSLLLLAGAVQAQESVPTAAPAAAPAPSPASPASAPSASLPEATEGIDERSVVRQALANNSQLISARLEVEQAKHDVTAEEGRYPYVFQADAGYTRSASSRLQPDDSVRTSTSHSYTVGTALRRTFSNGTSAELRVQGERFENDAETSDLGGLSSSSGYGTSARATLNQPFLRGAGTRVGESELRAARWNRTLAERSRALAESELVRDALVAYWELWYAGEALSIEQKALELSERQAEEARQQVAAGALSQSGVLTFETRVAELEESLVSAEIAREQRALELGRLMGSNDESAAHLAASTEPPLDGPSASRAEIEAALRGGSLELSTLQAQVALAKTRAEVAGENSRPRLDLEAYLETQGISERLPKAAERAGQLSWVTAHVGLVFELPLDDSRLTAERSSAQLSVRIAEQNVTAERERITAAATLARSQEDAAARRLALASRTLEVAEKTYEAEKARFEFGQSIPIQVQEAEDDLRRARLRVARARVDLAAARVDVLHLANRLLANYRG
jgi:outer membrane protein TolC